MILVIHKIEDCVKNNFLPTIKLSLTNSSKNSVRAWAALLTRQRSHPQLVHQHQTAQVNEGESPQSPPDSAKKWVNEQTLFQGTYVRVEYYPTESVAAETLKGV